MNQFLKKNFTLCCLLIFYSFIIASCSVSKQLAKKATNILLNDSAISTGHIGISIYEPANNSYWFNYNATKYFTPASNTKLFTLYAGMKYLGDSLVGLRYLNMGSDSVKIFPSADPTFLHPDYPEQPVFNFLSRQKNIIYCSPQFSDGLGKGWAWDDYPYTYMAQRSEFPIYGNLIRLYFSDTGIRSIPKSIPVYKQKGVEEHSVILDSIIYRPWDKNEVVLNTSHAAAKANRYYEIPMVPNITDMLQFIADTVKHPFTFTASQNLGSIKKYNKQLLKVYSQPSDSVFKTMMHQSDNFFAEQTLLMASNELLGYMNIESIIDTVLNNDLKNIPQRPKWIDGSGLSRYNLFTPQSFVYLLNKLKDEFGMKRLKTILPTGGSGTLAAYYRKDAGYIFAKTGSFSNNCSLSGFLITKKNKLLIFSVLANQYQTGATPVRRAVEKFLTEIREQY